MTPTREEASVFDILNLLDDAAARFEAKRARIHREAAEWEAQRRASQEAFWARQGDGE